MSRKEFRVCAITLHSPNGSGSSGFWAPPPRLVSSMRSTPFERGMPEPLDIGSGVCRLPGRLVLLASGSNLRRPGRCSERAGALRQVDIPKGEADVRNARSSWMCSGGLLVSHVRLALQRCGRTGWLSPRSLVSWVILLP